ncbi:MAG: prepilin-type N-terminal cleavage/methylation domain-containing protein [Verrucomicrobia bacterium]|nr:prepilin-type N-terminal cleavage/methylation domain-containing protein [Verrucomicrobiota bacterium]
MKLQTAKTLKPHSRLARRRGFTLPEIMIAMGVFMLVVLGVVSTHIFGLKMATITQTKLVSTQDAREALNRVRDDIRSAKIVYVGNGTSTSFTPIAPNSPQQGNAILIHQSLNTNRFVQYFLDPNEDALKRRTSGGRLDVVANYITNTVPFRAEDHFGRVLTNNQNNRVIRMQLEFYQWEYPEAYDYYRLQTKVTRRAIE